MDGFFLEYDDERSGASRRCVFCRKGNKKVVLGIVTSKHAAARIEGRCSSAASTRRQRSSRSSSSPSARNADFGSTAEGNVMSSEGKMEKLRCSAPKWRRRCGAALRIEGGRKLAADETVKTRGRKLSVKKVDRRTFVKAAPRSSARATLPGTVYAQASRTGQDPVRLCDHHVRAAWSGRGIDDDFRNTSSGRSA